MKIRTQCLGLVLAVFGLLSMNGVAMAQEKTEAKEKSDVSIKGEWVVKSGERSGQDIDAERLPPSVTISDKTFTIPSPEGGDSFVMAYKIVNDESPYHVDLEITEGPAEGTALGICKLTDGTLTLCYDPTGTNRPEEFKSTDENGFFKFVLKMKATKLDPAKMVGDWQCVQGVRAGEDLPDERLAPEINVSKKDITIPLGPEMKFVMSYTVNADTTPAEIDMKIEEGPGEGNAVGIVQMKDGKFYLCYDPTGQNRPESFESTSDNGFFLFVMEAIVD